jgi:glycosyltransferase involved in cell wall biosynthesis
MPQAAEGRESQGLDQAGEGSESNLGPLITVITPCLNAANTISETVLSVVAAREALRRAGWELEHLIVEGGSMDGTAELVANHAAKHAYCRVISTIRGGPYAAMNAGLRQARGRYTHVLNSDDLLMDPEAYASFVLEGYDKGATVLIASIGYFRRPDRQLRSLWVVAPIPATKAEWRQQLLRGLHYPHPGFISDTTIYRNQGFDESYSLSADYKLMQTILIRAGRPESTLICREPQVAMAEGGTTGNWRAMLKGTQQLAAINKELGIKASSVKRYWGKLWQRMRPLPQPVVIKSVEAPEP